MKKSGLTIPFKHGGKDNLQGRVFTWLTVIDRVIRPSDHQPRWLCKCKCGNSVYTLTAHLMTGDTKSCGCFRLHINHESRLPEGEAAFRQLLLRYQRSGHDRGYKWNLSDDQARKIFQSNCHYCGSPPHRVMKASFWSGKASSALLCNGIDRKDNKAGYEPGNVVACCRTCNYAKHNLGYEEFLAWIGNLVKHQQKKEEKICQSASS